MLPMDARILVVEDELFFRKLYRDLLVEEGYHVEICSSGDEAIELLQYSSIDLVLTDMVMPGASGLDVLRETKTLPDVPDVILVTGHASLESAIEALKNGARDYLVKPFNPDELKHIVHTCLEQRKLLTENVHLRRQIDLYRRGQSLSSLIDLDRLLPGALSALLSEMKATTGCAFVLKNGVTPVLSSYRKMPREYADELIEFLLPELESGIGLRQPEIDVEHIATFHLPAAGVWILPLFDSKVVKGGIVICDASLGPEFDSLLADLRFLCDQISLGFENANRYQAAQDLMYTDDLTGLYNHRYMQIALGHEIRRAQRYSNKFSLLFLDLDRFKQINDTYGHLAGSAALQEVGQLLRTCVRDVDTLFRFGGDEFAAILVEADEHTAAIVAERIRTLIEGHAFLDAQGTPSYVTVTTGYATFPVDATEKETLLDLADRAMYAGKVTRNVICSVRDIKNTDGLVSD